MSFDKFLDIRFGDPITALAMNSHGFAYGTMMGTILYQKFSPSLSEPNLIFEINDEPIYSLSLSDDNTLFGTIGDFKYFICNTPGQAGQQQQPELKQYKEEHDQSNCLRTQGLFHHDVICMLIANDGKSVVDLAGPDPKSGIGIFLYKLKEQLASQLNINIPPATVPMDYDGVEVLQVFKVDGCNSIINRKKDHCEFWIFLKTSLSLGRQIHQIDKTSGNFLGSVTTHKNDIVAFDINDNNPGEGFDMPQSITTTRSNVRLYLGLFNENRFKPRKSECQKNGEGHQLRKQS